MALGGYVYLDDVHIGRRPHATSSSREASAEGDFELARRISPDANLDQPAVGFRMD